MSTHRCFAILLSNPVAATDDSTAIDAGDPEAGYYVELDDDE